MTTFIIRTATALICLLTCCAGCSRHPQPVEVPASPTSAAEQPELTGQAVSREQNLEPEQALPLDATQPTQVRSLADRLGTRFIRAGVDVRQTPRLTEVPVPDIPGGHAIWGGTGRDDEGNIWFGVCVEGIEIPSAYLFSFDPKTNNVTARGDAVSWLKRLGIWRDGEGQMKIHSKIIEADDGFIYFATMDEQGESESRLRYPTWGGHLWRINRQTSDWEHLLATKEALIAVSCSGRYVYALGYFGHVLYQYDTQTAASQQLTVGSYRAHVSRNFLTDLGHHVYVPRVSGDETDNAVTVALVEFDEHLHEVSAHPLREYRADGSFDTHGLVGFVYLADASVCFTSAPGYFWHLVPDSNGSATVQELGWFHPEGESYPAALMTYDGEAWIGGLANTKSHGWQWVVRRLDRDESQIGDFDESSRQLLVNEDLALYGTNTRDDEGSVYFVGRCQRGGRFQPILLRGTFDRRRAGDETGTDLTLPRLE